MANEHTVATAKPVAEQPHEIDWSKTAFVAVLPSDNGLALRQLAAGAGIIEAPVIATRESGGQTVVGCAPTSNPSGMRQLLRALVPRVDWELWISGIPIPLSMYEWQQPEPLVAQPVIDENGAVDHVATVAMSTAIERLEAARDVLETLLSHAVETDNAFAATTGADDEALTLRRLELLRVSISLSRFAAELADEQPL